MKFCFGTVCWGGYLERYIDIFVNNYITIYRKLIGFNINHDDIADPKIVYCEDIPGEAVERAIQKLSIRTGKKLQLICDKHKWSIEKIMYSTRNRLRNEFRKTYPAEKKVFFYFPIDDSVRPEVVYELIKLSKKEEPTACTFKFYVNQGINNFTATTRPICSYKDIHPGDWGGYCAYNILNEDECPLYPEIAIPNVAFYIELYKAGYKEYESENICIDHLRHEDSHHFKYKDSKMSQTVRDYLLAQRADLCEKGCK
jgi:hypothetical protein